MTIATESAWAGRKESRVKMKNSTVQTNSGVAVQSESEQKAELMDSAMAKDIARHHSYVSAIEEAWGSEPIPRAAQPVPLESAIELGYEVTEADYAATVQMLLEEAGWEPAQEFVFESRGWLAHAIDGGIEPWEVSQFVQLRY